ncbi:hypothetical protein ROA7450_03050 [Roseovarius albus]|uniref:O-Antigen ligase n=1 Tax=Roseovarius albus TaxID=1247867 RepID=A0A1X6ZRG9_9RHOB|nr:hypothetical protein [Roseovarius albus]SLN59088.1 hypothetical protein ROA7450_03050 [Roseovarius albus]
MAIAKSDKMPLGLLTLVVFAFLISGVPKLNIRVGPVPVYMIDFVILLMTYFALKRPGFGSIGQPFAVAVVLLLCFGLIGETVGFVKTGNVFEHMYVAIRMTIAFLVFFAVGRLVRGPEDFAPILKAIVLGLLITSAMMILTSLPMTRGFVTNFVLDNNFLDPASERVAEKYLSKGDSGVRGRTLVGVSILGATFINLMWPLAALLIWGKIHVSRFWKNLALVACALAPLGVLMSYSRGPIAGMILIILGAIFLRAPAVRKGILIPVLIGFVLVGSVGIKSEVFFFERITNRTAAIFDDPFEDERESERILAYVDPFYHAAEHPMFIFAGEGNAINRSWNVHAQVSGRANHALFASSYYSGGLISSFVYMFLMLNGFYFAYWHLRRRRWTASSGYSQALFLSMVGLVPWVLFGHAMVSTARGAMMFFFIFGLLSTLRKFPLQSEVPPKHVLQQVMHKPA